MVHEVFNRNFWNLEQEQLSEMPAGNGVIYKAKPQGLLGQSCSPAQRVPQTSRPAVPTRHHQGLCWLPLTLLSVRVLSP